VTELERSLRQVALDLESLDRRFAVVGGLAVSIIAEPRVTSMSRCLSATKLTPSM